MDRTVLYREIVRIAGESSAGSHEKQFVDPGPVPTPEPDAFTKESNSIAVQLARLQTSLKLLRPRYLALSGLQQMTESERDDFDYTMRQLLQREQRRVRALESREQARRDHQEKNNTSFGARWFSNPEAEGIEQALAEHRQGVFFYLNMQLQKSSQALGELQSVRLARSQGRHAQAGAVDDVSAIERVSSEHNGRNLTKPEPETVNRAGFASPVSPTSFPADEAHLQLPEPDSPSMLLMQEEHDSLLADLNATLSKAQKAEQSLREIGELQSELSQHLASQSAQLNSLTSDAFRTTTDVSAANEQLERAKRSSKRASRVIIFSSLATGIFLLLLNGR